MQSVSLLRTPALRKAYVVSDDEEKGFDEVTKQCIQGV